MRRGAPASSLTLTAMSKLVFAALATLALATGAPAATPNVTGVLSVSRAIFCPSDEPCDPPLYDATLVFSRSGKTAARVRVNPTGRFSLRLAPGRYAIRATPAPPRGKLTPATVVVPAAKNVSLRLRIAT